MRKMLVMLLLPILTGCVICPYRTSQDRGPTVLEMEGIALNGNRTCNNGKCSIAVSLTATLLKAQGGTPVITDKISFGLYPGYELHMDKEGAIVYGICSPIFSCLILGIPIVDALLLEPFLPPTDGENVVRTVSPVGFCKYELPSRMIVRVTTFSLEYNGVRYYSNANGVVLIPWLEREYDQGDSFSVKLMSANNRDNLEVDRELQGIIGICCDVKLR